MHVCMLIALMPQVGPGFLKLSLAHGPWCGWARPLVVTFDLCHAPSPVQSGGGPWWNGSTVWLEEKAVSV